MSDISYGIINNFWKNVYNCPHKNANMTNTFIGCLTPYCSAHELYCPDCHVYMVECLCHCCDGISGWPEKRWRKFRRKSGQPPPEMKGNMK